MKRALALAALLGGVALAGGREPGPVISMPMKRGAGPGAELMRAHMAAMLAPLRPLSGKAFDIKWAQLMIDHHQMALDMAQHELMMGKDDRVKAAAQKVVDAQQREITQMQAWLKSWTGQNYVPQPLPMGMDAMGSMDRWFLESMMAHHQGAIDMYLLAVPRTQTKAVRDMARRIGTVQTLEIREYDELLKTVK